MDGFPNDTSRDALRVQFEAVRRLSVADRIRMADGLTQLARSMAREGIRRRHPQATEAEIDDRFAELVLGKELAARVREHARRRSESATS